MERVADIFQELHRQVESLKRQAAKAERYKNFKAEIKELSLQLFAVKIKVSGAAKNYRAGTQEQTQKKTKWSTRYATFENQLSNSILK
ncbi:MAG: hypothetical protein Ct9H300mP23_11050 [Nitrospinota bacterium]|nr:MAG: hypothetical protein Ct9H300mP23_11050 [Nitrospinota bacterium]